MAHTYYSHRHGTNPHPDGLPLDDVKDLFFGAYSQLRNDGYFDEAFGFECVDAGHIDGNIPDVPREILLSIRKRDLWPIEEKLHEYSEHDFFDVLEFLYQHVSKPIDGREHSYNSCGMHWETFNKRAGQKEYVLRLNKVLAHYCEPFEISDTGEVLQKPEAGFEPIFQADVPSDDANVISRINSAVLRYRRHGSTPDDRRQAVRDLSDVLEYLRPKLKGLFTSTDEGDLFNIANNFGLRHHNDRQKTAYDAGIWLSWMFYFYLATIHVALRKIKQ